MIVAPPPTTAQPEPRSGLELEWVVGEVFFDLDGTLIDSIAAVEHAWRQWAGSERIELPQGAALHGRTVLDLVSHLVPADEIPGAVARLTELEKHPQLPVPARPGAIELISALPAGRWAIVTSAARPVALARLAAAGLPVPPVLVTGDDVMHGKPAPDPYLAGRRRQSGDVLPVAFEDTVIGLRSARAAGCLAVGVPGTTTVGELRGHADALVASLSDVTVTGWDDHGLRLRLSSIG